MAINRLTLENYGALVKIEYAASWWIAGFNLLSYYQINSAGIVFNNGYAWQGIYCKEDSMGHQQQQALDVNGESWQQTVIGFIPGDEDQIEQGLQLLTNQRYLLRVTRPNGVMKIIGTPDQPLDLKLNSNSQSTVSGSAGTDISFTAVTLQRALTYLA